MNSLTVKEIAKRIIKCLRTRSLKEITLKNLIEDSQLNKDQIYTGLDWLVREDKIVLLVTPADTYILPVY